MSYYYKILGFQFQEDSVYQAVIRAQNWLCDACHPNLKDYFLEDHHFDIAQPLTNELVLSLLRILRNSGSWQTLTDAETSSFYYMNYCQEYGLMPTIDGFINYRIGNKQASAETV